jgi:hypothetical protein
MVTENLIKYLENIGLTKNILAAGQRQYYYGRVYSKQIPRTRLWTLGDRMKLLPLTESNPTDHLVHVEVS